MKNWTLPLQIVGFSGVLIWFVVLQLYANSINEIIVSFLFFILFGLIGSGALLIEKVYKITEINLEISK